jgi:hypothetical protein
MTDTDTNRATTPSTWHGRLPFYYGWLIVSGFVVTGAVNSSFYWLPTLFLLPMQAESSLF